MTWRSIKLLLLRLIALSSSLCQAEVIRIATAANFVSTLERLAKSFEQETGHTIIPISGSSGKLTFQILNNAPFDIFLSADQKSIDAIVTKFPRLQQERYIYAYGRLAVVYRKDKFAGTDILKPEILKQSKHIAMANPKTAPYGAATQAVLAKMDLWTEAQPRLVLGENIAQAMQFIETGAADIGFVSWAQAKLIKNPILRATKVPLASKTQLAQEAVILPPGRDSKAAREFLAFLKSKTAQNLIRESGYL